MFTEKKNFDLANFIIYSEIIKIIIISSMEKYIEKTDVFCLDSYLFAYFIFSQVFVGISIGNIFSHEYYLLSISLSWI